jgi:hypothetical protein
LAAGGSDYFEFLNCVEVSHLCLTGISLSGKSLLFDVFTSMILSTIPVRLSGDFDKNPENRRDFTSVIEI